MPERNRHLFLVITVAFNSWHSNPCKGPVPWSSRHCSTGAQLTLTASGATTAAFDVHCRAMLMGWLKR